MISFQVQDNKFLKLFEAKTELGCLEFVLAADEAQIIDIAVKPEYRRRGYGTKLLEHFIKQIAGQSAYIILEVRVSNLAAQKLYQNFGFAQIDRRKNYYRRPEEDALVWRLNLLNVAKNA